MSDVQLTREEKRGLIAQTCGWIKHPDGLSFCHPVFGYNQDDLGAPPDYFNSIDACHEMEKAIPTIKLEEFYRRLVMLTRTITAKSSLEMCAWYATAEQRCEAFGQTMGLWK